MRLKVLDVYILMLMIAGSMLILFGCVKDCYYGIGDSQDVVSIVVSELTMLGAIIMLARARS